MKKSTIIFSTASLLMLFISCGFPGGSINIQHSEYDHYYEMTAKFNPERTAAVEKYLDKEFPANNISFAGSEVDAEITLDNKTTFYMKKTPGFLHIKLDKEKNSPEAYRRVRSVCEGIKDVVRQ